MNEKQPPTDAELEQQLLRATSSEPLDPAIDDAETLELRAAWQAFGRAVHEVGVGNEPPIGSAALWEHVQQDQEQREEITVDAPPRVMRSSPAANSKHLLLLAATAATIVALAFGVWQVYEANNGNDAPQVVIDDPPETNDPTPNDVPPDAPAPELPIVENDPIVRETPEVDPIVENTPPEEPIVDYPTTPESESVADLYAWDDQLDDSFDAAASSAHEVRYGWRNTSTSYRYISYRFETIDDSISTDSL